MEISQRNEIRCDNSNVRGNVLGEPFPDENTNEDQPEELDTLGLGEDTLASVKSVEKLDGGEQVGEDNVGRIDEERSHESSETVTNELGADKSEDTDADIRFNTVVQVVRGEDTDGERRFSRRRRENRDGYMFLNVWSAGLIEMNVGTYQCPHTEGPVIEETPEPSVGHLESLDRVSWARDEFFHNTTEDIGNNLEEKLTDEHCLWTEVLCTIDHC